MTLPTLSQLVSKITRKPTPVIAQPTVHVIEVHEFVLTVRGFGEVTAIDYPYCDGIKRAYVEGIEFADWFEATEIF